MTLFKSLLLGSTVGFVAVAGAQAADLPSKKAAPATYVKVCDTVGVGFFSIPGTDTCVKLGGRLRFDAGYAPTSDNYVAKTGTVAYTAGATANAATTIAYAGQKITTVQDTWGMHARGSLSMDARTRSAYGDVRTYAILRLSQSSGVLGASQSPITSVNDLYSADKYGKSGPTLERAFIQFAGFTVGRATEVFAAGPSLSFGANTHFPSFANGALQASYQLPLAGGFSVTVGVEDNADHGQQNLEAASSSKSQHTPYDAMPVVVGNVKWENASFGSVTASAAWANNRSVKYADNTITTSALTYDKTVSGYAYAGFLTLNADMITKGDKFYLLGGFSSGINSLGFKNSSNDTSNNARDIPGIGQSYNNFTCSTASSITTCQNTKSTWVSAAFTHNWTSSIRQNVMAGTAMVDPGSLAYTSAATQKATFTSIGTNVIWSPVKDFDIGLEALYNRQSVTRNYTGTGCLGTGTGANAPDAGCKDGGSHMFYRLRAERTF